MDAALNFQKHIAEPVHPYRLTSRFHAHLRGDVAFQTAAPRPRTGFIARLLAKEVAKVKGSCLDEEHFALQLLRHLPEGADSFESGLFRGVWRNE